MSKLLSYKKLPFCNSFVGVNKTILPPVSYPNCKYCKKQIKLKNKSHNCKKCLNKFHPKCYKAANINDNMCTLCLVYEMPFADCDISELFDCTKSIKNNVIRPSQISDDKFECFKSKGLHFIHINARSIFYKLSEIKLLTNKCKPAILAITESWLEESFTNESISIEGYNIARRDRTSHGGGVLMYIRQDLAYNIRTDLNNVNMEDIWIEILLPKTKPIYVGTCYRAPHNNSLTDCLESTLSKIEPECETIILGDFNFCMLNSNNYNNSLKKNFKDLMNLYNNVQLIDKPTRVTQNSSTLLDHIYTNKKDKISQSGVIETGISDHFITYCTRKITRDHIGKHNPVKIRSMKHYSKDTLIDKLKSMQWSTVLECLDVVEAWSIFKTMFTQAMDDVAPEKEVRLKCRTEPWMNNEILELIYERDAILTKSNSNKKDNDLRKLYNTLRNKVTKMIRKTKADHFQNKVEEHKDKPSPLWKQLQTIGYSNKSKEKSRIVLEIDNEKCHDNKKIADHMCDFFTNVALNLQRKFTFFPNLYNTATQIFKYFYINKGVTPKRFKISRVTENFIYKELCKLNPLKSNDGIKAKFLKDGAEVITAAVTHIINLSIDQQIVPDELKFAVIKPLFKKNSRLEVGNYRPVCILPNISKILETAVYIHMEEHLKQNNLIYEYQSGFRKSHSTD